MIIVNVVVVVGDVVVVVLRRAFNWSICMRICWREFCSCIIKILNCL